MQTTEAELEDDDKKDDCFRVYKDAAQSYEDHAKFLQRPRYAALFELKATDVVLVNCSADQAWGQVRATANKRLRQFVAGGGHLFTTDGVVKIRNAQHKD